MVASTLARQGEVAVMNARIEPRLYLAARMIMDIAQGKAPLAAR